MNITVEKRFLSLVLTFILVLSLIPASVIEVWAAQTFNVSVLDGKIKVHGDGDTTLTGGNLSGDVVTATATAKASCQIIKYTYTASSHTVCVENATTDETISLSFNYEASGLGTLTVDGADKTATPSGSVAKKLAPGEKVTFVLTSPATGTDDKGDTASIVLSDFEIKDNSTKTVTVMKPAVGGTITVNGTAVTADNFSVDTDYTTGVALKATASSGYQFVAWVDGNGKVLSILANTTINPDEDMQISAQFEQAKNANAWWLVGDVLYSDLREAVTVANGSSNKVIILASNGTLSAGEYTIPAGVTLLIPFDDAHTIYGANPAVVNISDSAWTAPTAYRTLTMAANARLVINGVLEVGAKHCCSNGGNTVGGSVYKTYGCIDTDENAEIVVNENASLYAWGYIKGDGEVIANSGATVYEKMQIADYRGGMATTMIIGAADRRMFFPFSQYYVQNIEAKEYIYAGATIVAHAGVYAEQINTASLAFVGADQAMFQLSSGYIVKEYNGAEDYLEFSIYGDVSISTISVNALGMNIESSKYRLGINSNIGITAKPGSVLNIAQDIVLHPGVRVDVENGATMNNAANVFVMDAEDWGLYCRGQSFIPVQWSTVNGARVVRTSLSDVKINIDGTVTNSGYIYTSGTTGVTITSVISLGKTGVYNINKAAPTSTTVVHQALGTDAGSLKWAEISMVAATLTNGNGSTESTASATAGTTYEYCGTHDRWYTGSCGCCTTGHSDSLTDKDHNCDYCGEANITQHEYTAVVTAPTCTEKGYTTHTCNCGHTYKDTEVAATGHADSGDTDHNCDVCGTKIEDCYDTTPKDHNCDECGTTLSECSDSTDADHNCDYCDKTIEECYDNDTNHNCDECGTTLSEHSDGDDTDHNCDYCDAKIEECYDTTPKDHICDECGTELSQCADGDDTDHNCDYCNKTIENCYDTTPKDHKCDECGGNVGTHADSSTDKDHVCDYCGGAVENGEACFDPETDGDHNCDVCGQEVSSHKYSSVTTAPTCTEKGYTTHTCNCGHTYKDTEVAALGHTEVIDAAVAATCTTAGKTEGKHCSVCNEVLVAQEEIQAIAHKNKVHHEKVDATCVKTGTIEYWSCPDCGKNFSDEACTTEAVDLTIDIDPDNHDLKTTAAKAPACEAIGWDEYVTCQREGCTHTTYVEKPATGHNMQETAAAVAPTCTEPGKTAILSCANGCGKTEGGEEIQANGHKGGTATCQEPKECAVCGESYGDKNPSNHVSSEFKYKNNGDTHAKYYACCEALAQASEAHNHVEGTCVCGDTLSYTVYWNVNGAVFEKDEGLSYGMTPAFDGETPAKAHDTNYHYSFAGWAASEGGEVMATLPAVTKTVTYYAVFTAEAHTDAPADQNHACDVCGRANVSDHTYSEATCTVPATCTDCGVTTGEALGHIDVSPKDHQCDRGCGEVNMGTHEAASGKHTCDYCSQAVTHCKDSLDLTPEVLADCTTDGNNAYYTCSVCGMYYSDADATQAIAKDSWITPATGHEFEGLGTECTNGCGYTRAAKIGETSYETLDAALAAAQPGDTIVALTQIVIEGDVTWNLTGKKLDVQYLDLNNYALVVNGKLTIKGGEFHFENIYGLGVAEMGTLVIDDGKFKTLKEDYLIGTWGTTIINGGTFEAVYCNVNGFKGTLTVNGGNFTVTGNGAEYPSSDIFAAEDVATIYGGTYSTDISEYLAPEYKAPQNAEGKYVVSKCDHTNVTEVIAPAPTCTDGGLATYTCVDCQHGYTKALPATGHTDTDKDNVCDTCTKPLCTEDNHKYETIPGKAATCTATGLTEYLKCTACGHIPEQPTELPIVAHQGTWSEPIPATCENPGRLGYFQCTMCGGIFDSNQKALTSLVIPASGHDYVGEITQDPTCTEPGVKTFTCQNDASHTYTEPVSAKGHTYGTWITEVPATCTVNGVKAHYHCDACGADFDADKNPLTDLVIPATDHSYDEGVITTPATCTEPGVKTFTCQNDTTHTYTEEVEAKGHAYGEWIAEVPAKCTEDGTKGHYRCDVCGKYFDADKNLLESIVIGAPGHTVVTDKAVAPTCTGKGKTEGTHCDVCDAVLVPQDEVPALGHKDENTDHVCDNGCDVYQGTHADGNTDHICDYGCSEAIGTHADQTGDGDHICDYCGSSEVLTQCTGGAPVRENENPATVAEAGSYDSVVYCSECGEELSRDTIVIPQLLSQVETEEFTDSTIPETIKTNPNYNTVEKLADAMSDAVIAEVITESIRDNDLVSVKDVQTQLMDVTLQYSTDGETWQKADEAHFPDDGKIEIILPVPEGTKHSRYTYYVAHMFTSGAFGNTAGEMEYPEVDEIVVDGQECIRFFVTGLSPITVSYLETEPCADGHTHDSYGFDETNHWSICSICGETFAATPHTFENDACGCGAKRVKVVAMGQIQYTVSGQTVTVTHNTACKVGYLVNGKYTALPAIKVFENCYRFIAPADVEEVLLVAVADLDQDGDVDADDMNILSNGLKPKAHESYKPLDAWQQFAADVNNNGKLNAADLLLVARSQTGHEMYKALTW